MNCRFICTKSRSQGFESHYVSRMSMIKPNLSYRDDIDGLRALAVIAVILFHSELTMSGGYVGVDLFFVLSGYLITQRIIAGHESGKFSYKTFYTRRIFRLFPALFTTVVGTLVASFFFLWPDALIDVGVSAVSSTLSVANIYYFDSAGYWNPSAWTKPLLHFWSLSVEEQFYLVWPLVIMTLIRLGKRRAFLSLAFLSLIVFAVTTILTPSQPDATFYLTPFRFHEFALGALCVWFDRYKWPDSSLYAIIRNVLVGAGLLIILLTTFVLSDETVFPGWIAIVPALATAMIIVAREPAVASSLLSNRPMTFIGRLSYSLYLIHWPVLVFCVVRFGQITLPVFILAMAITVPLAIIQYRLIETPLRRIPKENQNVTLSKSLLMVGLCTLPVLGAAGFIYITEGVPGRYPDHLYMIASTTKAEFLAERSVQLDELCRERVTPRICGHFADDVPNVLIVGDSHAVDGLNIMTVAYPNANYLIDQQGGCPLLTDLTNIDHARQGQCKHLNPQRFAEIDSIVSQIDHVVFSHRISQPRINSTQETADWFIKRGVDVIILGASPQFKSKIGVVPTILTHRNIDDVSTLLAKHTYTDHYLADDIIEKHLAQVGGVYVRKIDFFCPDDVCDVLLGSGMPVIIDNQHLTLEASQKFGRHLPSQHGNLFDNSQ